MSGLRLSDQLSSYVSPEWKRQKHFTNILFRLIYIYMFYSSFEILEFTLFTIPSSLLSASIVPIDGNKQMTCNYILRGSIWWHIYPKLLNQKWIINLKTPCYLPIVPIILMQWVAGWSFKMEVLMFDFVSPSLW